MDYAALGELIMMALLGTSVLVVALGWSIRQFLAPTLRELFGRENRAASSDHVLAARVEQLEDRIDTLEAGVDRLSDAHDFDRKLEGPKLS